MSAPLVMVFPRGQLSHEDKAMLTQAGVVAIEADDPELVQQLNLAAPLVCEKVNGDQFVRAALGAIASFKPVSDGGLITGAGRVAHEFVRRLSEAMNKEAQS